jgi:hypothetical protein
MNPSKKVLSKIASSCREKLILLPLLMRGIYPQISAIPANYWKGLSLHFLGVIRELARFPFRHPQISTASEVGFAPY